MAYLDRDASVKSGRSRASSARSRGPPSTTAAPAGDMFAAAASGVMSMLKTSMDSGDIGDLSFNKSRLPSMPRPAYQRRNNVARQSISSQHSNNSYTPSQVSKRNSNSQAWDAVSAISQGTHVTQSRHGRQGSMTSVQTKVSHVADARLAPHKVQKDTLSEFDSRLTSPFSPDGRSYSLTQPQPTFGLRPHRSATSLRSQGSVPYPPQRPSHAYPARLRRPGYRAPSPALSDMGGSAYLPGYRPGVPMGDVMEDNIYDRSDIQPHNRAHPSMRQQNGIPPRTAQALHQAHPSSGQHPGHYPGSQFPRNKRRPPMPSYNSDYTSGIASVPRYANNGSYAPRQPTPVMMPYAAETAHQFPHRGISRGGYGQPGPVYAGQYLPPRMYTPQAESLPSASEQGSSPPPSSNPPTPKDASTVQVNVDPIFIDPALSDLPDDQTEPYGFPNYLKYAEDAGGLYELDSAEPAAVELAALPVPGRDGFVQRIRELLEKDVKLPERKPDQTHQAYLPRSDVSRPRVTVNGIVQDDHSDQPVELPASRMSHMLPVELPATRMSYDLPAELSATRTSRDSPVELPVAVESINRPAELPSPKRSVDVSEKPERSTRLTRAFIKANTAPSSSDQTTAASPESQPASTRTESAEPGYDTEADTTSESSPQDHERSAYPATTFASGDFQVEHDRDYAQQIDLPPHVIPIPAHDHRSGVVDTIIKDVEQHVSVPVSPLRPGEGGERTSLVSPAVTQTMHMRTNSEPRAVPGSFPDETNGPPSPLSRPMSGFLSAEVSSNRFSLPPDTSLLNDQDASSDVVTDVAVRLSVPRTADHGRPQLVSVLSVPEPEQCQAIDPGIPDTEKSALPMESGVANPSHDKRVMTAEGKPFPLNDKPVILTGDKPTMPKGEKAIMPKDDNFALSKSGKRVMPKDDKPSLRESFFRVDKVAPLQIKKPHVFPIPASAAESTDLSSFIRRSFPRRQSIWSSERSDSRNSSAALQDNSLDNRFAVSKPTGGHLPGLKEDSQEDMSIKDYRASHPALRITPTPGLQVNPGNNASKFNDSPRGGRAPRMTLGELRNIPSLNFSRLNLIDKLNEALESHSRDPMEHVRRRNLSGIHCPSPLRPASTDPLRARYTSFFAKPEDFQVPEPANLDTTEEGLTTDGPQEDSEHTQAESTDIVAHYEDDTPSSQEDCSAAAQVGREATPSLKTRSPSMRPMSTMSRPVSPEELLSLAKDADRLSIPSVTALSERLSHLLPSIKHLMFDTAITDERHIKETLDEIHHLGQRPDSEALLRSSTGLRQMAAMAEDIATNGTHDSAALDAKVVRLMKELPPLPEDTEKFSLSDSGLDKNTTTLGTETVSCTSDQDIEVPKPALLRVKSLNDMDNGDEMHPGFPLASTKRLSGPSTHHSRPWNLDEYYPWNGESVKIDIDFSKPILRRNSSASTVLRQSQLSTENNSTDTGETSNTVRARSPLATQSPVILGASPTIESRISKGRNVSKPSLMGSLSRKIGLGGHKVKSPMRTIVVSDLTTRPGDRYPSTALLPPSAMQMDEVRSFFSDSTSNGSNKRRSFRKHIKIIRSRFPGGPATLSASRLQSLEAERQPLGSGNRGRRSQSVTRSISLFDDRFTEPENQQNYDGLVGMGKVEFQVKRVAERLRLVLLRTSNMLRTLSHKRDPAARRLHKQRERAEWLDDSLYSGT